MKNSCCILGFIATLPRKLGHAHGYGSTFKLAVTHADKTDFYNIIIKGAMIDAIEGLGRMAKVLIEGELVGGKVNAEFINFII